MSSISAVKPLLGLVSIMGGIFLTYLAYENVRINKAQSCIKAENPNSILKGAMINALSPHPYLFWFTVGAPIVLSAYAQSLTHAASFILGFYLFLVGSKVVLARLVNHSKGFFAGQTYIYLMKLLGLITFILACILFKEGFALLME